MLALMFGSTRWIACRLLKHQPIDAPEPYYPTRQICRRCLRNV